MRRDEAIGRRREGGREDTVVCTNRGFMVQFNVSLLAPTRRVVEQEGSGSRKCDGPRGGDTGNQQESVRFETDDGHCRVCLVSLMNTIEHGKTPCRYDTGCVRTQPRMIR